MKYQEKSSGKNLDNKFFGSAETEVIFTEIYEIKNLLFPVCVSGKNFGDFLPRVANF